ncbi:MAG: inositol monophosphatase [Pseudomonadota bacterium]
MLTADQETALIGLVREVAAAEIMSRFRALAPADIQSKAAHDDLVTEADTASEAAITEGAKLALPGALVVGEEAIAADPSLMDQLPSSPLTVMIDPVDGTWNFANGLAVFGVILSVQRAGETVFGLLYDPVLDDWVMARKGGGAWFCRPGDAPQRLEVSTPGAPGMQTGYASIFLFPPDQRAEAAKAMQSYTRVSSIRCSCHEYRLLTQGKIDFVVNPTAKPWDHAAGALAVAEAGGVVELIDGRAYDPTRNTGQVIAAAAPKVLDELRGWFA